jgi:hypothetical protein
MSALKSLIEKSDLLAGGSATKEPDGEGAATAAPETRQSVIDVAKLRASAYIAIAKLGRRLPKLVNADISVMQTFFDAMTKEDKETQLSLQAGFFAHFGTD